MSPLLLALQIVVAPPVPIDMSLYAKKSDMPVPASTVPPMESLTGTVGTPGTYRPADSAIPRITRAATVVTDTAGAWSVTWTTALPSAPVTLPIPLNSGAQPVVCNVITSTATGAAGKCWLAQTTALSLGIVTAGLSLLPFANAAAATQVQLIAVPKTQ